MMKVRLIAIIGISALCSTASGELLDPRDRDETISDTVVSVTVERIDSEFYRYSYRMDSGAGNNGTVRAFKIDLKCNQEFADYEFPDFDSGRTGMGVRNPGEPPRYSPAIVRYDHDSGLFGISRDRDAFWGPRLDPGETRIGMTIISPLEPGMREYSLVPAMPTGDYDFESLPEDVTMDDLPQVWDFEVTGLIQGPACPGVTPPPEAARFEGVSPRNSQAPDAINELLTYSEPLKDRLTISADQEALTLTVHYHERIDPSTFRVQPAWARRLFNAEPGTSETVELPIRGPRNRFQFEVHPEQSEQSRSEDDWHHSYKEMDVFEVRVRGESDHDSGE